MGANTPTLGYFGSVVPHLVSDAMRARPIRQPESKENIKPKVSKSAVSIAVQNAAQAFERFQGEQAESEWESEIRDLQDTADFAIADGQHDVALQVYERAARNLDAAHQAGHDTLMTRISLGNNHALALKLVERFEDAEQLFGSTIALLKKEAPSDRLTLAELFANLSGVYAAWGKREDAFTAREHALKLRKAGNGNAKGTARFLFGLGLAAAQIGKHVRAVEAFSEALEILDPRSQPRLVLDAGLCLAASEMELGSLTSAEEHLLQCVRDCQRFQLPTAGLQVVAWKMIAAIRVRTNRNEEAQNACRGALRVYRDSYMTDAIGLAEVHFNLALLAFGREKHLGFKFQMLRAADLLDEQKNLINTRMDHFRGAYDKRLQESDKALSQIELDDWFMTPGLPTGVA